MIHIWRHIQHFYWLNFCGWHCYKCMYRQGENPLAVLCGNTSPCRNKNFNYALPDRWRYGKLQVKK